MEALKDTAKGAVDESRASALLGRKVDQLIGRLEGELAKVGPRPSARPAGDRRAPPKPVPLARTVPGRQVENDLGTRLKLIHPDSQGEITVADLERALNAIKHRPTDPAQVAALVRRTLQDGSLWE